MSLYPTCTVQGGSGTRAMPRQNVTRQVDAGLQNDLEVHGPPEELRYKQKVKCPHPSRGHLGTRASFSLVVSGPQEASRGSPPAPSPGRVVKQLTFLLLHLE